MDVIDKYPNILDPDLVVNEQGPPYALFARLRAEEPVHWNPPNPAYDTKDIPGWNMEHGFWVLSRYADVFDVSRNPAIFSCHEGGPQLWDLEPDALTAIRSGMMGMDPPQHSNFKRLVFNPFSPSNLRAFEPEIAKVARELVDAIAPKGKCEFVFDIASSIPVYTFCVLMGIPEEDREHIFQLGNRMADFEGRAAYAEDPMKELFAEGARMSEIKRKSPDDSMLSAYVNGEVDGEKLTADQINMFFTTLAVAGHETTRNTAVHFMRLMLEHPEQYDLLRSDLDKYLPNAIEEVLRFSPPVLQFRRTANRDTEIGDVSVKKGDKVYLSYPAANRDPEVFEDPDRFDILRPNARKHLSFGMGPHVCLGAQLARMQLKMLLKEFITRLPDFKLDGEITVLRSIQFNAITAMPLSFTPESSI